MAPSGGWGGALFRLGHMEYSLSLLVSKHLEFRQLVALPELKSKHKKGNLHKLYQLFSTRPQKYFYYVLLQL